MERGELFFDEGKKLLCFFFLGACVSYVFLRENGALGFGI